MINYALLGKAQAFYMSYGYKYIEVPWRVSKEIANITCPEDGTVMHVDETDKVLVASGEQGFLYLWAKGYLAPGKYQTITPCFRQDTHGILHTKQFMKLELFDNSIGGLVAADREKIMIEKATIFFESVSNTKVQCVPNNSPIQRNDVMPQLRYDLELNGEEIGSYGIRDCALGEWVYGTGLALPRFSRLVD